MSHFPSPFTWSLHKLTFSQDSASSAAYNFAPRHSKYYFSTANVLTGPPEVHEDSQRRQDAPPHCSPQEPANTPSNWQSSIKYSKHFRDLNSLSLNTFNPLLFLSLFLRQSTRIWSKKIIDLCSWPRFSASKIWTIPLMKGQFNYHTIIHEAFLSYPNKLHTSFWPGDFQSSPVLWVFWKYGSHLEHTSTHKEPLPCCPDACGGEVHPLTSAKAVVYDVDVIFMQTLNVACPCVKEKLMWQQNKA